MDCTRDPNLLYGLPPRTCTAFSTIGEVVLIVDLRKHDVPPHVLSPRSLHMMRFVVPADSGGLWSSWTWKVICYNDVAGEFFHWWENGAPPSFLTQAEMVDFRTSRTSGARYRGLTKFLNAP